MSAAPLPIGAPAGSPAPTPLHDDPLLECLEIVTRLLGRPVSATALVAELPVAQGALDPELVLRAAERHGFTARIVKRPLGRISRLLMPAILLLKESTACVLVDVDKRKQAKIALPEAGFSEKELPLAELNAQYTGYAIFVQPALSTDEGRLGIHDIAPPKHWFWGTLWRFKRYYLESILAGALVNVLTVATSLFTMNVYDRVVPNNAQETLIVLAVGTALAVGFEFLARSLRAHFLDTAGKKADVLMASRLFAQAIGLKMAARPSSAGSFSAQLKEFESLREFMTSATLTAVMDLPFGAFFIWIIALIGGPLYLVPLLAIPIVVLAGMIAQIPLSWLMRSHLNEGAMRHGVLIESIEGMETLKALSAEGVMQQKYENYTALTGRSGAHARFIASFVMNLALFIQQIATIGMVVWGVDIIAEGKLTTGALIASVILSGRALAPLQQLASLLTRYQYARATYRTLSELMRRPTERPRDRRFIHRPDIKGGFALENVTFAYPRHKHEVLRELNLAIAPGERVAVLGRIGSGKSTLLKLMLGLYVPGSGAIRVDDVDLEQYDPADLRRRIGYVSQDARLFFGTLRDNVTLGMPRATDEAILEAARLSGLDRLVNTHPHGFDLVVGEHGEGLSGGQRQAVALARTILRQPSALLMDEPTSAMDHTSEQVFIQGMQRFLAGRTLVLVTHKPTLLTLVSRIVVIDGGKIVMDGPRDEVLKRLMRQEPGAAP